MKSTVTRSAARVDKLLGRIFSVCAIGLSLESGANFIGQLPYMNQPVAWSFVLVLWATTLSMVYTFWFGKSNYLFVKIHALYMPVLILSWPFMLSQEVPQSGSFYPWIWWGVDTGLVAMALAFKWRPTVVFYFGCIFFMQLIFSLPMGGSHQLSAIVTDSIYTLLSNGTLAVVAVLVLQSARSTDQADDASVRAQVALAEAQAKSKEKLRIDGLIHDSVLTALMNAAESKDSESARASSALSAEALTKLEKIGENNSHGDAIACSDLFDSIILAAQRIDPEITISKNCPINIQVNVAARSALTEATIQAVQNSLIHAGSKAKRSISLYSSESLIRIVVKDDGVGFRPSRVNKGRLGIKVSILGRMEAIGGSANVMASPGKGTMVALKWGAK